jgi:uncharacterized protein YciI
MQFLILAYDATDAGALDRRMAVREAHIANIDEYKAKGNVHIGAALLDESGKMIGSVLIVEFPSLLECEAWLSTEPYVTGKAWHNIKIQPCKIGPSFVKN